MKKVETHRFSGKTFDIDLDTNVAGYCDRPDGKGNPCLHVGTSLHTRKGLKDLIHEMIHACRYSVPEDNVYSMAEDMSRLLWRLDFRFRKE